MRTLRELNQVAQMPIADMNLTNNVDAMPDA